jgi:molybdopterin molybdotransferase
VAIVMTGEELLPAGEPARGCRIPDMNAPMLWALVSRDGGIGTVLGPLADDREELRTVLLDSASSHDAILVSGGSSTGPEDHAPALLGEIGKLEAHGVALRPASPVGLGFLSGVPVVLLPGNPVSCLCAYDFFGGRVVHRLGGRSADWPYRAWSGSLAQPLRSASGRVDYVRVRLSEGRVEPVASSGASILSSTTRADGFVVVPADRDGVGEGELVTVWLYD